MNKLSLVEEVLGLVEPRDAFEACSQAHEMLTGEPFDPGWVIDAQSRDPNSFSVDEKERYRMVRGIGDILLTREINFASTLIDWPHYQSMIRQFGTKADGSAAALMIGSYSALSSRSFTCLARNEYGANKAIIVDPVGGKDKFLHGNFIFGSGLDLPLQSKSMDFVHTNCLIHMLKDPSKPEALLGDNLPKLFTEINRVLKPGGQLCMVETVPGASSEYGSDAAEMLSMSFASLMRGWLGYVGLGHDVNISPAEVILDADYLFDREQDFAKYPRVRSPQLLTVYAQK